MIYRWLAVLLLHVERLVIHDSFELPDRLDKFCCRFLVRYLLRDNPAPAERGEVALSAASFFGRLGQEQITIMVQKRAFVEMPLITPGQEAKPVLFRVGLVVLRDEDLTALYHAEWMASYSARVTVNSSGSSTRKATVMSASFETMQPFSTAKRGNFLSSVVAFNIFLIGRSPFFSYR